MVRLMVGLLVQIGRGDLPPTEVERRLQIAKATQRLTAPAAGLVLIRVLY
jgi:tRNA U38,U39,U40 pseudouridine synthase TruA